MKPKLCEFPKQQQYPPEEVECGEPATYELFVGADGDHWLYLCDVHRPSFLELPR